MADQSREARLNLVLSATDDASKVISDFISKTKKKFKDLGKTLSEVFSTEQMVRPVADSVNKINEELSRIDAGEVSKALVPIGETAVTVFQQAETALVSFSNDVQKALVPIGETATKALMPIEDTVTAVTQYVDDRFKEMGNVIDAEFKVISDEIVHDMELIYSATEELTRKTRNAFSQAFLDIKATILDVFPEIKNGFEKIPTAAEGAAQKTESVFVKAAEGIKRAFRGISEEIDRQIAGGGGGGGLKRLFSIGGQMDTMYAGMSMLGAAAPLIGLIKQSTQAWAEYDHQMRLVNQEMNLSGDRFQWLENRVIKLSNDTGIAADELAKGLYNIAATGGKMQDPINALNRLELVTKAMKAGNADLNTVTKALDSVMGAYGKTVKSDKEILDIMFAATNNGQMRFMDLAKSVGASATSAAQAGVKYYELAAAQATLTNTGLSAENASQRLNSLIIGIAASSPKAAEEAKNLGIAWGKSGLEAKGLTGVLEDVRQKVGNNAEELRKLFPNQRAYLAYLALMGNAHDDYLKTLDKVKNSQNSLDNALKKTEGDMHEQIEKMKVSLQNAGMQLAVAMAPAITEIANRVRELAMWFQHLSPQTKKLIGDIMLGATAFLTLGGSIFMAISGFGAVFTGVKRVGEAFSGAKKLVGGFVQGFRMVRSIGGMSFNGLVAGLEKLGGAISRLIFGPWKALWNGIINLPKMLANIPAFFGRLASGITRAFGLIRSIAGTALNTVIGAFRSFISFIPQLIPTILNMVRAFFSWENVIKLLRGGLMLFRGALTMVTGPWGALILVLVAGVSYVISHWNQIVKWVQQNFGHTIPTNFKQFQALVNAVWTQVRYYFEVAWNAIRKVVMDAWHYIGPTIMDGIKEVQKYWNEIWPQIQELFTEVWNVMKVILGPAVAWMYVTISGAIGFISGAWKSGWNAIKDVLKFIWDLIVSIIKTGWDVISGLFKVVLDILTGHWDKAWNDMVKMLSNVWNDIKSAFHKLVGDALDFGKNFVKMIADGITSGIHWVENAVSNVAAKIKSFLGFHSPTEKGPASESDRWAPNFVKMFADGLNDNAIIVELAATRLAQSLKKGVHLTPAKEMQVLLETKQMVSHFKQTFHPIERIDPFLEAEAANAYDRRLGNGRVVPLTTSMYDRVAGHGAHHVNVHIHIDGRSQETDRQLLDQLQERLARQFRTHLKMHTS